MVPLPHLCHGKEYKTDGPWPVDRLPSCAIGCLGRCDVDVTEARWRWFLASVDCVIGRKDNMFTMYSDALKAPMPVYFR